MQMQLSKLKINADCLVQWVVPLACTYEWPHQRRRGRSPEPQQIKRQCSHSVPLRQSKGTTHTSRTSRRSDRKLWTLASLLACSASATFVSLGSRADGNIAWSVVTNAPVDWRNNQPLTDANWQQLGTAKNLNHVEETGSPRIGCHVLRVDHKRSSPMLFAPECIRKQ